MQKNKRLLVSATITPLASIFGSGFLVIVPILTASVGEYAILAMTGICAIAFAVGSVIRFNIKTAEATQAENIGGLVRLLELSSNLAIVLAYIISVCLYLNIMAAFVLGGLNIDSALHEKVFTTAIVCVIVIVGFIKGLKMLERLEKYALFVTLAVILLLTIGFLTYDEKQLLSSTGFQFAHALNYSAWEVMTIVAGTLIVVQGFETTRYMGNTYSAEVRIRASRYAQLIATFVYILFVAAALPIVHVLQGQYSDNSLITLAAAVAGFLVLPLVTTAALSQFAAAIADVLAASGNMEEVSQKKIKERTAYLLIGVCAVALTWAADTFQILALASRAFALYYLLQCLVAIKLSPSWRQKTGMLLLALVLAFIVLFAVPAG